MPKLATNPKLVERMNRLTTCDFRRAGYTLHDPVVGGFVAPEKASGIVIFSIDRRRRLHFQYHFRGQIYVNVVQLVEIPSNLGNGYIWYFVCPRTGKRCRTLYATDGYFYHRSAFPRVMYYLQTASKQDRAFAVVGNAYRLEREFLERRFPRTSYNGRPTKRYARHLRKIERSRSSREQVTRILAAERTSMEAMLKELIAYANPSKESDVV